MIQAGVKLNAANVEGDTALHHAVRAGAVGVARLLVRADPALLSTASVGRKVTITTEVKPPYIAGAPGFTIWSSEMPASASAFCWASAPARVMGAIAPARVNGVTTTG